METQIFAFYLLCLLNYGILEEFLELDELLDGFGRGFEGLGVFLYDFLEFLVLFLNPLYDDIVGDI